MCVCYHKLHICAVSLLVTCVYVYGSLRIQLPGRANHPSHYCVVIAPYTPPHTHTPPPPYYTDGTITAGPIAATGWDHTGPICGMKHQSQLHLCVFLIHPLLHSSSQHPPPPSTHTPSFLSSATIGKLRASLSQPKWERLICSCYLFVTLSLHPPSAVSALLSPPFWKHTHETFLLLHKHCPLLVWRLKLMAEMDIFSSVILPPQHTHIHTHPLPPPLSTDECVSLCSSK